MIDSLYALLSSPFIINNSDLIISFNVFIISFLLLKIFKTVIISKIRIFTESTSTEVDDVLVEMIDSIGLLFYIVVPIYLASKFLELPDAINSILRVVFICVVIISIIQAIQNLILRGLRSALHVKGSEQQGKDKTVNKVLSIIVKVFLWFIAGILILQNLGYDVTTLVGGLGIVSLVIGISLQGIIEQIFSFFSIFFDKPFQEGDYIKVGKYGGNIRHIGVKSTRITTTTGQELVISNKDLTEARVENHKKMKTRTVIFSFGLEYGTSISKLKLIKEIVQDIVEGIEDVEFMRIHFSELGDYSFIYEVAYKILSRDYEKYKDIQEQINYQIVESLAKHRIKLAYPTQRTLIIN